jgi:hypothetical protein
MEISFDDVPESHNPRMLYGKTKVLWFGKYKGKTIGDVINGDPNYIAWCVNENKFMINAATQKELDKSLEAFKENRIDPDYGGEDFPGFMSGFF